MTGFEIALFVLGVAFIIISFFIVGGNERTAKEATISALDNNEFEELHEAFVEKTNRKADLILHDTEDKLESLSNDKIIAVGEYSDQMLEKIESNHKEVVFLYQMLNEKEESLKATVMGMENTRIDCEKMLRDMEKAKEAVDKAAAAAENRLSAAEALAKRAEVLTERPVAGTNAAAPQKAAPQGGNSANTVNDAKPAEPAVKTQTANAAQAGKTPATVRKTTAQGGTAAQAAAQKRKTAQPQSSVSATRPAEASENLDTGEINRNDEIIALHKSGKSVMEIAKLLGMGQGEVKLIIDLYC